MKWHHIEHRLQTGHVYREWSVWLCEHVGRRCTDWQWSDSRGHYFICFIREEDAIAFKLRFKI